MCVAALPFILFGDGGFKWIHSLCVAIHFISFMNGYIFTFLPICCRQVADQLISGKKVLPENYSCITVLLSDICGFTTLASSATPIQVSLVDKVAVIILYMWFEVYFVVGKAIKIAIENCV